MPLERNLPHGKVKLHHWSRERQSGESSQTHCGKPPHAAMQSPSAPAQLRLPVRAAHDHIGAIASRSRK
jgi:hypothetical protein